VRLGIETPEQAAKAAAELGGPVLVTRQASRGAELFCGAVRDPHYGPVIAIGSGGIDVEKSARSLAILGPLSHHDAAGLLREAGLRDPHRALARAAEAVSGSCMSIPTSSKSTSSPDLRRV